MLPDPKKAIDIAQIAPGDVPDKLGRTIVYFATQVPVVLTVMFVAYGFNAVFNASIPYFIGQMIDMMTMPGIDPVAGYADVWPWFIGLIVFGLILSPLVSIIGDYYMIVVFVSRFGNLVRRQSHRHVIRHAIQYFQDDFAGRIANKVNQMGPALRDVLRASIAAVFYVMVFAASTCYLLADADIVLLIPMIVWILLYLVLLAYFVPRVRDKSITLADAQSYLMGRIVDSYTNIMTVKLFARRQHEDSAVVEALENHAERFEDKNRLVFWMNVIQYALNSLMIFVIGLMSMVLWRDGHITPGQVAMIIPLTIHVKHQMQWIKWEITHIFEYLGVTEDSIMTISKPHKVVDVDEAEKLVITKGHIKFDNITFHYGKTDGVIDNLTLDIPPGQKIGLVGHSGAGKTTLANLLLRFYDLEGGRILIDGQDIANATQDSLRQNISMVTQDTSLLHRAIEENIRYGRPEATMAQVIEAAKRAHAHEFIADLEDPKGRTGYDAHVGERGVKLSGGQRQRIAIARIILKDAPILILDEATSALDSEIESYIQEQMVDLMKGKTVLAIAHRLSTISHLDRLIIMHEGKIIEDGTHEELLANEGHYAKLWALQSGGFLPE